jgi:hypothetical protein
MATTYKVRYKNHCTPQEQILTDGRWYLDSDCGRKLTGNADTSVTLSETGTLATGIAISTSALAIVTGAASHSYDFIYIKNTSPTKVYISLTDVVSSSFVIGLSENEAFASEISTAARVWVKTSSGTATIEHFTAT